MAENKIIFLTLETLGWVMIIFGYLIKYKGKLSLVAGVCKDDERITDKKAFGSLVGGSVLLSGVFFSIGAIGMYLYPGYKNLIESLLLLSLLVTIIMTYTQAGKYIKRVE